MQKNSRYELDKNGYTILPNVLDVGMLQALRHRFSEENLSAKTDEGFSDSGAFFNISYEDPLLAKLLSWPASMSALSKMGFNDPKLHSFYISTKPPGAKGLSWHSDLFYEYSAIEPSELFLIYYLDNTTPENGCLRVVPGSHAWTEAKRHAQPENSTAIEGEVDITIQAGDLFIGDRRILHATHANRSKLWRTCITIAYAPSFNTLPEPIQALIVKNPCLPHPQANLDTVIPELVPLLPKYVGSAEPIAILL